MRRETSPTNEIQLRGLEFVGHHGVFENERIEGRRFRVDVNVEIEHLAGFESDKVEETLDYREISGAIMSIANGESCALIEYMAEEMSRKILGLPAVISVDLRLRKQAMGVPGAPTWVGVRIQRFSPNTSV